MATQTKMSTIMMNLALLCLRNPTASPSQEAANAALLLANVAWNRTLKREVPDHDDLLMVFTRSNPRLWSELRSSNTEALIRSLIKAKEKLYPRDRRVILICGMRGGNVRVEWCDEKDYPISEQLAQMRIAALSQEYGAALQQIKTAPKKPR